MYTQLMLFNTLQSPLYLPSGPLSETPFFSWPVGVVGAQRDPQTWFNSHDADSILKTLSNVYTSTYMQKYALHPRFRKFKYTCCYNDKSMKSVHLLFKQTLQHMQFLHSKFTHCALPCFLFTENCEITVTSFKYNVLPLLYC